MDIYQLINFAYKRFKDPKSYWAKAHKIKRSCEIFAIEEAIMRCMDNPFKDGLETLEEYAFELDILSVKADNVKAKTRLEYAANAVYILIEYIKNGGGI